MALIFVSYSRKDKTFTQQLVTDLKARGVPVWLDLINIPAGKRWDDVLENALEDCSHLLLVVTKTSVRSQNVRDELGYAIEEGKEVIPLILDGTKPPLRARRFQQVDFQEQDYADALRELLHWLPHSAPEPTVDTSSLRTAFWQALLDRARKQTDLHAHITPRDTHALYASAGKAGFKFGYMIRQHSTSVTLAIDTGDKAANKAAFDALYAQRAAIEAALGRPLGWQRMDDHRASRITLTLFSGGYLDEADWDTIQAAMVSAMIDLARVLGEMLAEV